MYKFICTVSKISHKTYEPDKRLELVIQLLVIKFLFFVVSKSLCSLLHSSILQKEKSPLTHPTQFLCV